MSTRHAGGLEISASEAADPDSPANRAAAAHSATSDVFQTRAGLEVDAVQGLLQRLQQLRRELQGIVSTAGTEFRAFSATELLRQVDAMIQDALRDIENLNRATLTQAAGLGVQTVNAPLDAARIAVTAGPSLDVAIVTASFDNTADLLSAAMRQYRDDAARLARQVATTGKPQAVAMSELAAKIGGADFEKAAFQAERIVRTEVGRVLNASTFARMEQLARDLPFLRKGWRASRDSRTRTGHREAGQTYGRGNGIPIAERFRVNVYTEFPGRKGEAVKAAKLIGVAALRFPIDPETTPPGRIAAGATIMCRCNAFTDLDLAALRDFSTARGRSVAVPGNEPAPVVPRDEPTPPRPAPKPKAPLTAAAARKKLEKVDAEWESKIVAARAASSAGFEAWYHKDQAIADNLDLRTPDHYADLARLKTSYDQLFAAARKLINEDGRAAAMRKVLYVDASNRVEIRTRWSQADLPTFGTAATGGETNAAVRKRIETAIAEASKLTGYGTFGRDVLLQRARKAGQLVNRAFANQADNSINLAQLEKARTVVHELGHVLEFNTPDMRQATFRFLERRTAGERLRRLDSLRPNQGYGKDEKTKPDKFTDPYTGKEYAFNGGRYATEVLSMGLEQMYADAAKFAREDPDYFDFVFNVLRGKF